MKSLFLRIFLSFWIAMGLILAGGMVMTSMVSEHHIRELHDVNPNELTQQAKSLAKTGGEAALRAWLSALRERYPALAVFIVDAGNREITGAALSPLALDRLQSYRARDEWRAARRLSLTEGRTPYPPADAQPPEYRPSWWAIRFLELDGGKRLDLIYDPFGTARLGFLEQLSMGWLLPLFCFAVSGLVCWLLARYLCVPVRRLRDGVRRLAAGELEGSLGQELACRRDELGGLTRDVDAMASRIRDLIQAKERLVRDVSHELRSPLARLTLALSLARRGGPTLQTQFDRIERECGRFDAMIGQILAVARLRDEPARERVWVSLDALVREVVDGARIEAQEKSVTVRVEGAGPDAGVTAEPEALASAFDNVLRNALRFSPSGGTVHAAVRRVDGAFFLEVADRGPGVPANELERLFEPFFRSEEARDRASGGIGLGLAIAAAAIKRHAGSVEARLRDGGGLIVRLILPREGFAGQGPGGQR